MLEFLASLHPTHPFPEDVQVITALCDCLPRSVLWMTLLDAERQPGPPDFPTTAACRNMCSHRAPSFPAILTDRASHSCESLHLLFGAEVMQSSRRVVFPSARMVFSPHFVFGQGSSQSFLLRNRFWFPFAEQHSLSH